MRPCPSAVAPAPAKPLRRGRPRLVAAVLLLCGLAFTGAQAQWSWRDANGRTVYSDQPPPPEIDVAHILRQPGAVATPPRDPDPAAPQAATPSRPSLADQELEFRKRRDERQKAEQKQAEEAQAATVRADNCRRARDYLQTLEQGVNIVRPGEQGQTEFLDETGREAEKQRARSAITDSCS